MANLRFVAIKALDSTTIRVRFSNNLNPLINTGNVTVTSNVPGVPDVEIRRVEVSNDILNITTLPMVPYASYKVTFKSTDQIPFNSLNGTESLLEDGRTNTPFILGPEEPDNEIKNILINFQKDNVYNLITNSIARDIINSQSNLLSRALYDVGQLKNDNYLEFTVFDERKERGRGPYDRLLEEGAFEIVRVSTRETGATTSGRFNFDSFPSGPITLQSAKIKNEELEIGSGSGTFDNLTLTVTRGPVTKVNSITVRYDAGGSDEYNINQFGYQLNNSRFDREFSSTLLTLEPNQIRLNQEAVIAGFDPPSAGDIVTVTYEYKSLGRIISEESVLVSQVLDSVREVVPPITNEFSLSKSPIVNSNNSIIDSKGIQFLDPQANPPFGSVHPAFTKEIPFRFDRLPSNPGEYAVDYTTGRVFVYGASSNDGTGNFPPVATYKYRNVFVPNLDYTYNPETYELVASPLRDLLGESIEITFDFEPTLVPGVDFKAQVHQEVLDERIENRLISTNSLRTLKTPVTSAFRVFNETSGEVYRVTRFNNNTIFFNSRVPPRIEDSEEVASFKDILNETLIINKEFSNILGTRIFEILLSNNRIAGSSEDVIGASFNTSISFSRADLFNQELYFDGQIQTVVQNTDRLNENQYMVDYFNGIIYLGVDANQLEDIGTANYKTATIKSNNLHIISVNDIFYQINNSRNPSKRLSLSSFNDSEILTTSIDRADERFLNQDETLSYTINNNVISVTDDISNIRGIFDAFDLNNNDSPTNFADSATFNANIITLSDSGVPKQSIVSVNTGLVVSVPFITNGAEVVNVTSIIRLSDNAELFDNSATISGYDITLSGLNSPVPGDVVRVIYSVGLNGSATPIIDYNRGNLLVNYTYLADEILISYEYGDNVLDFTESTSLGVGDEYFVTYKAGALRNALLKNFGTLVDIPVVSSFDTTLPRERYRDILQGALQSFTRGPTIPAMERLVSSITKITPRISEAIFNLWSLGISYLFPNEIRTTGNVQIMSGKFGPGVLVSNSDETISLPLSSNLRLEEGTLEFWVIPEWDGIDNDATLTFSDLTRDGYALESSKIFIGASSFNPTIVDGSFSVNRSDELSPIGLPSKIFTHIGMFIFYDEDEKGWKVYARDQLQGNDHTYTGKILSSGEVYDVNFLPGLGEINDVLRSDLDSIIFEFNLDGYDVSSPDGYQNDFDPIDGYLPGDGYVPGFSFDGIQFMADNLHYFFDWGKSKNKERFSIFKDGRGYLNFHVYDKNKTRYPVTTDISHWKAGIPHHIATTWRINSSDRRDELHLFVDGKEVNNIMRFGGRPKATSSDRFRTVKPEIIVGTVPKNVVVGNDLVTTQGSAIVESLSVDFGSKGIVIGDSINIREPGFGTFNITSVSGRFLTLSSNMPASLNDARFSVNEYSAIVDTPIDLYTGITVSIINGVTGEETEIPGLEAVIPSYSISKNLFNQNVLTLLGSANAGDQIAIRTLGLNFKRCHEQKFIWGNNTNIIKTKLPPPISLNEVNIKKVLLPLTPIGPSNSTLISGDFVSNSIPTTSPTNTTEGRTLSVRINGNNVIFSPNISVTVNGLAASSATSETLLFTNPSTLDTTEKWLSITGIDVVATPINTNTNSISIEIKEKFNITESEGNNIFPVIRFSYQVQTGSDLEGTGNHIVSDSNGFFPDESVNNTLVISTPPSVAGTYTIDSKIDNNTITISPTPSTSFTGGSYNIFNTTIGNSGFQNGFFTFQTAGLANTAFILSEGVYEFDYATFLEIPINPVSDVDIYIGSDFMGNQQANAILDELRILNRRLTDVRVGETIPANQKSITTDFTSLNPFTRDKETLTLIHFDKLPFVNDSDLWISFDRKFYQSDNSVNNSFENSVSLLNRNIIIDNTNTLVSNEGSIEFWVSPRFDTYNDPNIRFYFDASSAVTENLVSSTRGSLELPSSASEIISVRLQTDVYNTGKEFFTGGNIASNGNVIFLGKPLPKQTTPVKVTYIPKGLSGDRISIFKDSEGFISFVVRASGTDYEVRQPIFWQRDTWHRILATYKVNTLNNQDQIRLFVDGEERGTIRFGQGLLFGQGVVFGQGFAGDNNSSLTSDINFNDPINQLYIGSSFEGANFSQSRYDNIRFSNLARSPLMIGGQARDVNFNSNRESVLPVVSDLFTTELIDFNKLVFKAEDFSILRDEVFGLFNFDITVIDSFDIVLSSPKIKQVLETLISSLKPATSKVSIDYIQ